MEENKLKALKRIHSREMRDWAGDVYARDEAEFDAYLASEEYLASWDCEICHWEDFTGRQIPHKHAYD